MVGELRTNPRFGHCARVHEGYSRVSVSPAMPGKRRISKPQILETARRLFRVHGYRGTTLAQVAAELGVTRAALYHWLPSKESVLCEIHELVMDDLWEKVEIILATDADDVERLEAILRTHVRSVAANMDAITVFFQDEASLPEGPARRIAKKKSQYDQAVKILVRSAQAKGAIRPDLDASLIVMSLMGMCNWLYQWFDPRGSATADEVADHVVAIAMEGLILPLRMETAPLA